MAGYEEETRQERVGRGKKGAAAGRTACQKSGKREESEIEGCRQKGFKADGEEESCVNGNFKSNFDWKKVDAICCRPEMNRGEWGSKEKHPDGGGRSATPTLKNNFKGRFLWVHRTNWESKPIGTGPRSSGGLGVEITEGREKADQ